MEYVNPSTPRPEGLGLPFDKLRPRVRRRTGQIRSLRFSVKDEFFTSSQEIPKKYGAFHQKIRTRPYMFRRKFKGKLEQKTENE